MSVYSTLFAYASVIPASPGFVYTVPSGYVVVVRDVEYVNYSGASATFSIQGNVAGSGVPIVTTGALSSGPSGQWKGRVVLPAGAQIQVTGSTSSIGFSVSGYLLQ